MTGELRFEGVSRRFRRGVDHRDDQWVDAAQDISFTIGSKETVGVIGANGAGKTTLLRLAAGVTRPDRGRIARRGRLAAVIELGAGFHRDLTGAENVGFAGSILGMSRAQLIERLPAIVDFSGLGDDIHRPVKHYSTGMLARLAFAVAAHADPELLLLDEVLSVGDLEYQRRCYARMSGLVADGTTLVVVSHNLPLISAFCDRTLLLDHGSLIADGPTDAVIARYLGRELDRIEEDAVLQLEVRAAEPQTEVEEPITFELDLTTLRAFPGASARLDLAYPTHPAGLIENERTGQFVFGSCSLPLPLAAPGDHHLSFEVEVPGLIPGSYQAVIVVDRGDGLEPTRATAPFRIAGVPGLTPTGVLHGSWVLDRIGGPGAGTTT